MAGPAAIAERAEETRALALAGVAARVVNAGIAFLTQILFARAMGVSEYGVWAAANTIYLMLAGVATLGLAAMPQRFWPIYAAAGDAARLRGLVRFAVIAPLGIGVVAAALGAGIVWLARDLLSPPVATAAMVAMLAIPAQASLDVVEGIALARAWKMLAYGVAFVLRPLLIPVVFLGAWLAGGAAGASLAMYATAAAAWVGALLLIAALLARLRPELGVGPAVMEPGLWIRASLPVMLIDGVFLLMTSTDVLLLSFFRSDAEVGVYAAAARLVALVAFVHQGLTWASGHHFSGLHAADDRPGLAAYAARTTRWTFLPSVGAALVAAATAPFLLQLFGRDFASGGLVTAVLLAGLLARAAVGPAEQLLVMTGEQGAAAYAYAWAFFVNLGLGLWLAPAMGGLGAALATAAAYVAAALILAREVRLRLGFSVSILSVARRSESNAANA